LRSLFTLDAIARRSAEHPWLTVAGWAVLLVLAVLAIMFLLGDALTTEQALTGDPESSQADVLIEQMRGPDRITEIVIVRSPTLTVDDPAFRGRVQSLYSEMLGLGENVVEQGFSYLIFPEPSLISADRQATIMPFVMAGSFDDADRNIDQVLAVVEEADGQDGFEVLVTGGASIGHDFQEIAERDLRTGETFGAGVALIILVVVFGALVAALIPLGLALVAITAAVALSALVGQVFELTFFVTNMITMMGLAVGIDYSLFIVSRYREERAAGRDKLAAVGRTGATATRAVLFSGMTVILALLGLLLVPTNIFRSLAIGAILVVAAAVLAAMTLLPAILGLLGDRVNSWRVPYLSRRALMAGGQPGGFWDRLSLAVMARPILSVALATGLLILPATAFFSITTGAVGVSSLPDSAESRRGFDILDEDFSFGLLTPVEIVVQGDYRSPAVQDGVRRLEERLAGDPAFVAPLRRETSPDQMLAVLSASLTLDPNGDEAYESIKRLRAEVIPESFAGSGARVLVTGLTAQNVDFFDLIGRYTPLVFAFVLSLSFLLLMLVFRSLVVPVKAILMNLLSVGAAYGLIVLAFQKGWGSRIFGFQQIDIVEAWIPLFLFSILFGLSMDYHVFLLSRIRERFDQTHDNTESVAFGVRTTGGIITGAAIIMVAVFSGFAAGDLVMFQQLGFGLAVAVFIDATIVRSVLVPAAMRLLGDANWWLPRRLSWLPDLRVEPVPPPGLGEAQAPPLADPACGPPTLTGACDDRPPCAPAGEAAAETE
jgi:putative drug exporter of the RND superfamily